MKLSTVLLLAGAGVVVYLVVSRRSSYTGRSLQQEKESLLTGSRRQGIATSAVGMDRLTLEAEQERHDRELYDAKMAACGSNEACRQRVTQEYSQAGGFIID